MIGETIRQLHSELPPNVELVAVSKFHPVESVIKAYEAGQRVFAESRPQELFKKVTALEGRMDDIRWHFIGHLQTNKLKMVLPYADLIESVDSVRLLDAIQKWAQDNDRTVNVLLEVHVAAEQTKQGFSADEIFSMVERCSSSSVYDHVRICGLMGMATFTDDESVVRGDFHKIRGIYDAVREKYPDFLSFKELSIGMSGDYPIALEYGTTMVRIGTKIFGAREYK